MTTFDSREKAYEDKFAHDENLTFKARARRNRLFGEWLAGEMGLSGDAVKEYAGSVITADLEEDGDDDVIRKVVTDVEASSANFTSDQLAAKLLSFMEEARRQVLSEA